MLKLKLLILWSPDAKNWLTGKDPDAGKDWRQEEKGMTENDTVGWHHQLDGHEFEQALGVDDGRGSLACCSLWGRKESDTTEWLNWTARDLPDPGIKLASLALAVRFFTPEPPGKPSVTYMWNLISDTDELIYETEADSQTWKTSLWLPKGKGDEGG